MYGLHRAAAPGQCQGGSAREATAPAQTQRSYMKRELNQNLSVNEVYHTNSLKVSVRNMLCSELHCQQDLFQSSFHARMPYVDSGIERPLSVPAYTSALCHPTPVHVVWDRALGATALLTRARRGRLLSPPNTWRPP